MTLVRTNYTELVLSGYSVPRAQVVAYPRDMPHSLRSSSARVARVAALVAVLTFVATAPASAVSAATYEKQVVKATNAYRADNDRRAVTLQRCVDRFANSQARWMAKHDVLQHRSGRLTKIMRTCSLRAASENIAWNYDTGTKAVRAWSRSAGHASNMRASAMRYIGVGTARSSSGEVYVAQVFGAPR